MGWLRRSPFSAAALLVYLFASIAGALHRHEGESHSGAGNAVNASLYRNTSPQTADDDGHSCAICIGLHQAKTPPILTLLVAPLAHVREPVIIPAVRWPFSIATSTHARAPPAI